MTPNDARELILHDHVQIRILLTEIDGACQRCLDGDEGARLNHRIHELVRVLWNHLAVEERLLTPLLRQADAWGPVRADALTKEHERQRGALAQLAADARRGTSRQLATATRCFIGELRADMDGEEHEVLSRRILRDDVIAIDQSDG